MNTALTLRRESILPLVVLTAVALLAPMFVKQQLITGTIVNASLIIATAWTGIFGGLLVGVLPSTVALITGTLPAPLMPMVPFIIIANSLVVLSVCVAGKRNYWAGVATASVVKFAFLYATSTLVMGLLLDRGLPPAILSVLSWPQLITALLGGIVAFAVTKAWTGAEK